MRTLFVLGLLVFPALEGSTGDEVGEKDNSSNSHSSTSGNEQGASSTQSSASNCISSSSSSSSSSDHKWFSEQHDHDLVEAVVLILMVFCALSFELIWHRFTHNLDKSYRYGDFYDKIYFENEQVEDGKAPHEFHEHHHNHFVRIDFHGNLIHHRLFKELSHRIGAEFMTLGFLAFIIFTVNQSGGFENLSEHFAEWNNTPQTDSDWLHLCEEVHMKLFVGMILYFIIVAGIIRHSIKKLQSWEQVHLRNVWLTPSEASALMDAKLSQYRLWREHFFTQVSHWYETNRYGFDAIVELLEVNTDVDDPISEVRSALQKRLSMAGYLAHCVECGVEDSIEIRPWTWVGLLLLLAVFALIHRYLEVSLQILYPIFVGIAFILLIFCYLFDRWMTQMIAQRHAHSKKLNTRKTHIPQVDPIDALRQLQTRAHWAGLGTHQESKANRGLQVFLFLNSYMFSRSCLDKQKWKNDARSHILVVLVGLLLYGCLFVVVPLFVPRYLAMRSLPGYMSDDEIFVLISQLIDDRVEANGADGITSREASTDSARSCSYAQRQARLRKRANALIRSQNAGGFLDGVSRGSSEFAITEKSSALLLTGNHGRILEKLEGMDARLASIQTAVCPETVPVDFRETLQVVETAGDIETAQVMERVTGI